MEGVGEVSISLPDFCLTITVASELRGDDVTDVDVNDDDVVVEGGDVRDAPDVGGFHDVYEATRSPLLLSFPGDLK